MAEYLACRNGDLEFIKQNINSKNVNFPLEDQEQGTILILACSLNKLEIVKFLIKIPGIDLEKTNMHLMTALHIACSFGYFDIVKLLISHQKNIDQKNGIGLTPFSYLTATCKDINLIKKFIKRGVNIQNATLNNLISDRLGVIKTLLISGFVPDTNYIRGPLIDDYFSNKSIVEKWETQSDEPSKLFLLMVLKSDEYLIGGDKFFDITCKLPIEIQMIISNMVYDSLEIFVNSRLVNLQLKYFE